MTRSTRGASLNAARVVVAAATIAAVGCGGDDPGTDDPRDDDLICCAIPPMPVPERISEEAAAPTTAPTFAEALAEGRAELVFITVPSGGFVVQEASDRVTGITAELLRSFANWVKDTHEIDVEVVWVSEERWADFYGYVRDSRGGVFGVGNVTITEPRREEIDFSPPYMRNIAVLATHEDVPELDDMDRIAEAFAGFTALRYPGTLHETRLLAIRDTRFPDMTFREIASNDELIAALSESPTTFGYIDVYNLARAMDRGVPLRRHPIGDDGDETFGVIMPHGSDWTPVIEAYFDDFLVRNPQWLGGLISRYLGDDVADLVTPGG